MICNNCKSTVRDGSAFCTKCGARMVQPAVPRPAPAPVRAPAPNPAPAYNPTPAPKKKTGAGVIIGIILLLFAIGAEAWYLVNWYNNEGGFFPDASVVSGRDRDDEDEEKTKDKDKDKDKGKETDKQEDKDEGEKPGEVDVTDPEPSKPEPSESASLPAGAELNADASVEDILGDWVGELTFTRLDGYENMPGAPENIDEFIAAAKASSHKYTMSFREDGRWDLYIDFMSGMRFDATDMRIDDPKTPEEQTAHLYKGPEDGKITISVTMDGGGGNGGFFDLKSNVFTDSEGIGMSGKLLIELTNQGITITVGGDFTLRPDKGEE